MPSRKLARYRAKRDFTRTAEPSGARQVAAGAHLRFVIQKHAARRLHYDLRLELAGVFKSWAVTRGPSLDPADKRLAVEVEDHPLDYGDFEGTIPRGEYGGGTVQLWDRGYWSPEGEGEPSARLRAGNLRFRLDGQRLHGDWVLVRLRNRDGGKRTNWLLIKSRDAYARPGDHDALLAPDRSVASGRPMKQIAAGKGRAPRPFVQKTRAARAKAEWHSERRMDKAADARKSPAVRTPMQGFIEPQLCRLVETPPEAAGWVHEIKLDGYRLQLHVQRGRALLRTRKGLDWTARFGSIAAAARRLPDCVIDGEAVAMNQEGVPDFSALQAALSEDRGDALVFFAFDLLYCDGHDLRRVPLTERKQRLQRLLQAQPRASAAHIRYLEHVEGSGAEVLRSACNMSLEGIVSKRADAPYESGRTGSWIKAKCRAGHEVVIGGWTSEGERLRSLVVGVYRGGRLIPVGRVGTGFSAEKLRTLMPRLKRLQSNQSPFDQRVPLPGARNVHWLKPQLVAEIEFAGWTEGGNVRQAAFKGLREDKPAAEVQAETPAAVEGRVRAAVAPQARTGPQARTARAGKRAAKRAGTASSHERPQVMGLTISNPDKALWPDDGEGRPVTKWDLAQYFATIGHWMLPHIEGRPCSIVRAPDGIGAQRFFQRHAMAGTSSHYTLLKLPGDQKPYVAINGMEALIEVAQTAGIELHPGNGQPGHPELPGRLVFDLDPAPELDFEAVIRAAQELRARLAAVGLESLCKTTGGKGLHVVTPLVQPRRGPLNWSVVKAFARDLCSAMVADSPERYVINMAKRVRTGHIFLDYLRNDLTATAVAPLSPRARPGAQVSMPLSWSQVRAGLDPRRFTLRTAPALLAKSKPWQDYAEAARPIAAALSRMQRSR